MQLAGYLFEGVGGLHPVGDLVDAPLQRGVGTLVQQLAGVVPADARVLDPDFGITAQSQAFLLAAVVELPEPALRAGRGYFQVEAGAVTETGPRLVAGAGRKLACDVGKHRGTRARTEGSDPGLFPCFTGCLVGMQRSLLIRCGSISPLKSSTSTRYWGDLGCRETACWSG